MNGKNLENLFSSAGLTSLWAFQRTSSSAEVDFASLWCFSPALFSKSLSPLLCFFLGLGLLEILIDVSYWCTADQSKHEMVWSVIPVCFMRYRSLAGMSFKQITWGRKLQELRGF